MVFFKPGTSGRNSNPLWPGSQETSTRYLFEDDAMGDSIHVCLFADCCRMPGLHDRLKRGLEGVLLVPRPHCCRYTCELGGHFSESHQITPSIEGAEH